MSGQVIETVRPGEGCSGSSSRRAYSVEARQGREEEEGEREEEEGEYEADEGRRW